MSSAVSIDRPSTKLVESFISLKDQSAKHPGFEFVGQARPFRNAVIDEERKLSDALDRALAPIRRRLRHRSEVYADLFRAWEKFPRRYRLIITSYFPAQNSNLQLTRDRLEATQ
jgi:hypothetical protein